MLNSIRFHRLASLQFKGEAENRTPAREGQGNSGNPSRVQTVSAAAGIDGMVGDGMAGSWSDVNQGSRAGKGAAFMAQRHEEPRPEGDRASIGAKKRGNARGAKGGRKVNA